MIHYLTNSEGHVKGVRMSVRDYRGMRDELAQLRLLAAVQREIIETKEVIILSPQPSSSILQPN